MKKIIIKTDEEREEERLSANSAKTTVTSLGCYCFPCQNCKTAFFGEDIVMNIKGDGTYCLQCNKRVYRCCEKTFSKYYKLA